MIAIAVASWLFAGLITWSNDGSMVSAEQQRENRELLLPAPGWLSLDELWTLAPAQLRPAVVVEAQLVRQAGNPVWLVRDGLGRRLGLSALDGQPRHVDAGEALEIAALWVAHGEADFDMQPTSHTAPLVQLGEINAGRSGSDDARPLGQRLHRVAVGAWGRELLISELTGEVVHDSTPLARLAQWIWHLGGLWGAAPGEESEDAAPTEQDPQALAHVRMRPATLSARPYEAVGETNADLVVELVWRRQGGQTILQALTRSGEPPLPSGA